MTRNPSHQTGSDRELDRLLATAAQPELPPGAAQRLADRLAASAGPVRVIARPGKAVSQGWSISWLAGLPLAASLALGIYLGAAGDMDSILPASITGQTASAGTGGDPGDFSGIGDVEADAAAEVS